MTTTHHRQDQAAVPSPAVQETLRRFAEQPSPAVQETLRRFAQSTPPSEPTSAVRPDQPANLSAAPQSGLQSRAENVAQVLRLLAILALVGGVLLTVVSAAVAGEASMGGGTLVTLLLGAMMTGLAWAQLQLGAVVAEYIAVRNA